MFHCQSCLQDYPNKVEVDGKLYNLYEVDRRYCYNCSPPGEGNKKHLHLKHRTEKECSLCHNVKPLSEFHTFHRNHQSYYRSGCKSCMRIKDIERLKKTKLQCIEYKGGKCQICGYNKCNRALQFHHRNPKSKTFQISNNRGMSFQHMKSELDQCDLLCANCHAEIEADLAVSPQGQ